MKATRGKEQARPSRRQSGQSMVEYLVVCGALAIALFVPLQDVDSPDQSRNAIEILLDALKTVYSRVSFALSISL